MAGLGATPNVQLRTVAADLRQDWPTALRQKGFDRKQPTAWLVEGLMIGYLPGDAQERLLEQITELSAAGSTMAADHLPGDSRSLGSLLRDVTAVWKERGCDLDFDALIYPHERNDAENVPGGTRLVHLRDQPRVSCRRRRADGPRYRHQPERRGSDQLPHGHPQRTLTNGCREPVGPRYHPIATNSQKGPIRASALTVVRGIEPRRGRTRRRRRRAGVHG